MVAPFIAIQACAAPASPKVMLAKPLERPESSHNGMSMSVSLTAPQAAKNLIMSGKVVSYGMPDTRTTLGLPALLAGVEVASVLADLEGVEATLSSSRLRLCTTMSSSESESEELLEESALAATALTTATGASFILTSSSSESESEEEEEEEEESALATFLATGAATTATFLAAGALGASSSEESESEEDEDEEEAAFFCGNCFSSNFGDRCFSCFVI